MEMMMQILRDLSHPDNNHMKKRVYQENNDSKQMPVEY
jgi:hypothetical protein